MPFPKKVRIVEVGPRDGLQNESKNIPTDLKIKFINQLSLSGLSAIETTSFVSPQWIPQMADHAEVMNGITRNPHVRYSVLVPNQQGLADALQTNIQEISVLTTVSETFSQKNTNCSIDAGLIRVAEIIEATKKQNILVRAYISCALGCPYEGKIAPQKVAHLAKKLIDMGCYQVSIADTIGIGTPNQVQELLDLCAQEISLEYCAIHFHDTYGQALTNIYVSLEKGIATIDSAVAGLGGCPYAATASGNVATEDVVYLLNGMHIQSGVNLHQLTQAGKLITDYLQQQPKSKVALALQNRAH